MVVVATAFLYYPPMHQKGYSPVTEKPFLSGYDLEHDKVNINQGDVQDLMLLPGIGEQKAADLVAYREQNGVFSSVEDLQQVKGIGPKLFEQIKDYVCL